ncbi:hypothetical protein BC829DRAFT_415372 [Chytridium lagenaria]|nr:hypothetical protein BC829DRAFT_415372 [Chytridium lagenaria]
MNAAHRALLPYSPYLARPARKQSEEMGKQNQQPSGTVFNIWYSKWAGGDRFGPQAAEKAETRCVIATDAGYTKASKQSFFVYILREGVVREDTSVVIPMTQDVSDGRGLKMREMIWWSKSSIKQGVAFVRFKFRAAAEFAKEAMYCQSMDSNEILNVRWATETQPKAAMERKRRAEEQFGDSLQQSLPALGEEGNVLNYANYYPPPQNHGKRTMGPKALNISKLTHPSPTREPPPPPPIQAAGVVSAETMQYLAYMAGRGQAERNVKKVAPKKVEGLGALAAYESDED